MPVAVHEALRNIRKKAARVTDRYPTAGDGEVKTAMKKDATASLCSLERVVRPAPTERTNGNPPPLGRGNEGAAGREGSTKRAMHRNERR